MKNNIEFYHCYTVDVPDALSGLTLILGDVQMGDPIIVPVNAVVRFGVNEAGSGMLIVGEERPFSISPDQSAALFNSMDTVFANNRIFRDANEQWHLSVK